MKLAFFTISAWLAFSALAAVPFYGRRDMNVTAGTHAYIDTSTSSNATSSLNQTSSSGVSPAEGLIGDPEEYPFHIRIGGPMQHVGTLRKYRLYWAIYNALKSVGEPYEGDGQLCSHAQQVSGDCRESHQIDNIVYNAQKHNTYSNKAHLTVSVRWSDIREKDNPGLRHEVYALIANIYRLQADDPNNCYDIDFPKSRKTKMCNLPTHLLVVFPVMNLQTKARVNVELRFNGATAEGNYKCDSSLTSISDLFRYTASPKLAKISNLNGDKFKLILNCQEKEACFDVDTENRVYIENTHWNEPKGCGPLGKPWY